MDKHDQAILEKTLKNLGFGKRLGLILKIIMARQTPTVALNINRMFDDGHRCMNFSLRFDKPDLDGSCYFHSYRAELYSDTPASGRCHTFYVGHNKSDITALEALNLLEGRAVHKTLPAKGGGFQNVWLEMNFALDKNQIDNYHIIRTVEADDSRLHKAVSGLLVDEIKSKAGVTRIVESLKKGNLTPVTTSDEAIEKTKLFISYNPNSGDFNAYDEKMKPFRTILKEYMHKVDRDHELTAYDIVSISSDKKKPRTHKRMNL